MNKKLTKLIIPIALGLLILLGIFSRSVEVINGNYIFGFDHGRDYLLAREIAHDHNLRLIGTPLGAGSAGIQGIFHGPGYYYILAIFYILFGADPYGGVVAMLLFGVAAIIASYLLGKRLFGSLGGLLVATFIALSPPLISQSRSIWNSHPTTVFIVLTFLFIYASLKDNKHRALYAFLAAFFAGFTYNFEFAVGIPLTIALLLYSIFMYKTKLIKYLPIVGGSIIAYAPMVIFEIKHKFMAISGLLSYLGNPQKSKSELSFVENNIDHAHSFLFNFVDSFPRQSTFPGPIILAVFILGFILVIRREKNKDLKSFFIFLASLPLVSFAIFSLLRNAVYHYYLVHLNVAYILLAVFIIFGCFRNFKNKFVQIAIVVILVFFGLNAVGTYTKMISYDLYDYGGDAKIQGKLDAINYVYNDAESNDFGVLVFSPPVYIYPYEYLFLWKGKSQYGYMPPFEKKKITYLIIEVDPAKPWSYKGWLETVIKDGKVLQTTTRKSGLIIQKRYYEEKN